MPPEMIYILGYGGSGATPNIIYLTQSQTSTTLLNHRVMTFWGPPTRSYNGWPWWGDGPPPWVTARPDWSAFPGGKGVATLTSASSVISANAPVPTALAGVLDLAIVVDDADLRIQYEGDWDSAADVDNWYHRSYHKSAPSEQKANLTFTFKGHWVELHGQQSLGSGAEFNCSIDPSQGTERLAGSLAYGPSNGSSTDALPCTWTRLSPAITYTLHLSVNHPPSALQDSFGLDYILYGPLDSEMKTGDMIRYHRQHNQIGYTGAVDTRSDWRYTSFGSGGGFNFTFYGNSATPYVYLPSSTESDQIYGTYDPSNNLRNVIAPISKGAYVPLTFDPQDILDTGEHRLEIVYRPSNNSLMYLDFIEVAYVHREPYPNPPTPISSLPPQNPSGVNHGVIIGAVVGGVLGLMAILSLLLWSGSRYHQQRRARLQTLTAQPFRLEENDAQMISPTSNAGRTQDAEKGGYSRYSGQGLSYPVPQQHEQDTLPSPNAGGDGQISDAPPRRRFLVHIDSGLRIPRMRQSVVEVPPEYTAR